MLFKRVCVAMLLCASPLLARADGVFPYDEYAVHLRAAQEVAPLTSSEFGDSISLYNGATEFNVVDIDVPGNNALPVQLRRRFDISDRRAQGGHLDGFGEWDLDVPYLEGVFAQEFGWQVNTTDPALRNNRCTNPVQPYTLPPIKAENYGNPDTIWDGYQMHMPGGGFQDLLVNRDMGATPQTQLPAVTDNKVYPWVTKDYTRVTCLPALKNASQGYPGEGFQAVSADGTKTNFDWAVVKSYPHVVVAVESSGSDFGNKPIKIYAERSKVFMLASRVEDRFGNWVNYNYATDSAGNTYLASIASSDGRTITPTYTNGAITGATSNIGNWSYGYITDPTNSGYTGQLSLHTVTRPDLSSWTYAASGSLRSVRTFDDYIPPSDQCQHEPDIATGAYTYAVTAPFGATATYQFAFNRHGRSYVPWSCLAPQDQTHRYPQIYDFIDNYTIHSKQVAGPGLTPQVWIYGYSDDAIGENGYFTANYPGSALPWFSQTYVPQGDCPSCSLSKQVVVTSPTEVTKYTFGVQYARNEGRLMGTEVDGLDGTPLRTTTNTYVADSEVGSAGLPFPNYVGTNLSSAYKNPMAAWLRPQRQSAIVQDGVTFINQTNAWDVFARPTSVTRSSSLGYSKTDDTTYAHNTAKWVIGQVGTVADHASGQLMVENAYDPSFAVLNSTKAFGLLQKIYAYNILGPITDGTLKSVADGMGHTTTLSNWFRGIPQTVRFADGTTETAVVNDAGWITSLTDPIGAMPTDTASTTMIAYGYDPMGRVNLITYPANDSVAWTATTVSFAPVSTAEYGLPAGHWKHVISTGAARKTVYYDAMLRPLLQREEDASNAATIRYTEQAFDAANRATFASYPAATASAYNDLNLGTHTSYDGLGRPTSSAQDSELGALATRYAYLTGFQTKVTSPRGASAPGFTTTTSYQVFDSPDTSHPLTIASPMGVTTAIVRDVFGKPQSITRSGTVDSTLNGTLIHETRSYVYDTHQRICKRVEPETGATLMDYDSANNIAWTATGSTQTGTTTCDNGTAPANAIVHTYDARNRPLTETVPGSTNIGYSYFNDGALQTLTSGSNAWTYTYNLRRLPVTETLAIDGRNKTITHSYDVRGHVLGLTYPDGLVVNAAPNALGQPTQAGVSGALYASGVAYFPNGGMSGFTYGNGIVHTLTQNARQLPLESRDANATTAILDDTYTYDPDGDVTSIADGTSNNPNSRTMTYDGLDRLKTTSAPHQWWINATTTYDGLDNIRSNQVGNTATYKNTYSYDPVSWRLSALSGHKPMALNYDANGNITGKGAGNDSYTFDAANRMQSVNGKESYQYDGNGRRVKVTSLGTMNNGKVDYPIYDSTGQLITEDDQRNNTTTDYVSLNGSLVGKRSATIGNTNWTKTYEHTDALHSPVGETDGSGTLTRAQLYTPYGEPSGGTYSQGPGFTGHVTDASTGLTYAQQRYYDPQIGRFLSVDPVQANANTGASFNRYAYANNNPYKFTDPDGRDGQLFWTAPGQVTFTVTWTMTGVPTSNFTPATVNAQIAQDFSGAATINGANVNVTAQGVYQTTGGAHVNTVNVVPDTAGVTKSGRSETNAIGGNKVTVGAGGAQPATKETMSHELGGHGGGAGDQYSGGLGANGKTLSADVPGPANVMKDLSGQPANAQSRGEIINAKSNINTCAKGVSAGNGGC